MNKYLEDFFDDTLKNNDYYEMIREFAKDKDWNENILSSVVNAYDDDGEYFNPYKFMDAIEDYMADDDFDMTKYEDLYEVIDEMWDRDFFENY